MESTSQTRDRSLADLMRELREETTTLFKQEIALAKTEMAEKATKATRNVAAMAVGGAIAYAGFIIILVALSVLATLGLERAGLAQTTAEWVGPGLIGLAAALIGYLLLWKAKANLSEESFAPEKTIQSLKEDKQWTQEKLSRA